VDNEQYWRLVVSDETEVMSRGLKRHASEMVFLYEEASYRMQVTLSSDSKRAYMRHAESRKIT
jgi:hypothetical protein